MNWNELKGPKDEIELHISVCWDDNEDTESHALRENIKDDDEGGGGYYTKTFKNKKHKNEKIIYRKNRSKSVDKTWRFKGNEKQTKIQTDSTLCNTLGFGWTEDVLIEVMVGGWI